MDNRFKILASLAMAAFVATASADGPGWMETRKVERIVVVASGGINIRLNPGLNGWTSQSGYGQSFASVYPDHPGLKSILATLLTAQSADLLVSVYLQDNTCRVTEVVLGG